MTNLNYIILTKILMIPAVLIAFTFHEYSHALAADKLGDKTPKFQGRLTLNPLSHIDWVGFFMIILFGFGYAKPIETNPRAYKHLYKDDLKVAFAGPLANVAVAFVFAIIYGILYKFLFSSVRINSLSNNLIYIFQSILIYIVNINSMLFLFNLIPIPGLDGFHILRDLFPKYFYKIQGRLYRYQIIIFLILIIPLPFLNNSIAYYVVGIPSMAISSLFFKIAGII